MNPVVKKIPTEKTNITDEVDYDEVSVIPKGHTIERNVTGYAFPKEKDKTHKEHYEVADK